MLDWQSLQSTIAQHEVLLCSKIKRGRAIEKWWQE